MATLAGNTLYKHDRRADRFIQKLKELSPFELVNGSNTTLILSEKIITAITNRESVAKLVLNDINNNVYKFSDLVKTSEFGGRRSGTYKEDLALDSLRAQINAAKMHDNTSSIQLTIASITYDISNVESTKGCPKSDFHLLDTSGNEVVWISHKDGSSAKDFQQWGGVSLSREPILFNHPETQQFINDLKISYPNGLPQKTTLYRSIDDDTLKMKSVYGNKFGSDFGQQNVTILLQGDITLVMKDDTYELSAKHMHYNGDSVDSNGYDPVLMAIYKGDRSNSGIAGARISISPIGGRKGIQF